MGVEETRIALGLAVLLAVVGFSIWALRPSPVEPGVTPENFRRLYTRMTKKEIEAILGEPNRTYPHLVEWHENGCTIRIAYFSRIDYAIGGAMKFGNKTVPLRDRPKTFFEHIRGFLGL